MASTVASAFYCVTLVGTVFASIIFFNAPFTLRILVSTRDRYAADSFDCILTCAFKFFPANEIMSGCRLSYAREIYLVHCSILVFY